MKPGTISCPILNEANLAADLAVNMQLSIRRLRRALADCTSCPASLSCPARQSFIEQTHAAIQQVLDEWTAPFNTERS